MIRTRDYRLAPSGEGPHADTWKDKPHRLVYDLCAEIERLHAQEKVPHPLDLAFWTIDERLLVRFDEEFFMEEIRAYIKRNNPWKELDNGATQGSV